MLTNILSGGNLGSMPIAEGAVSDLFGRPFFFSLYDYFLEVLSLLQICPWMMIQLIFHVHGLIFGWH